VLRAVAEEQRARFAQTWLTQGDQRSTMWQTAITGLRDETLRGEAVAPPPAPPPAPFDAAAVALVHQLPMEIERKFLLHGLPPRAAVAPSLRIEQGWLPGTLLRERLRQSVSMNGDVVRTRTIKLGRPGARIEVEEPVSAGLFDSLWPLTSDARIHKRRHLVVEGGLTWEIDVFLDRDLVLAEVELHDTQQEVPIPDWLAPFLVKEVTDDPAYLNAVMAQRHIGAPEDARS
jgi:adenylate cyclase